MSDGPGATNGHRPDLDADEEEAALERLDAEPLEADEAASGAAIADELVDESLDERVEAVIGELDRIERRHGTAGSIGYATGGRVFAVLGEDRLEVDLDPVVAKAALRTADTATSALGAGWITFTPAVIDRFALDRAEAWVRSAHRRASAR